MMAESFVAQTVASALTPEEWQRLYNTLSPVAAALLSVVSLESQFCAKLFQEGMHFLFFDTISF